MWTVENRRRYEPRGKRYPSDLSDEQWALIAPLIPPAKSGGIKPPKTSGKSGIAKPAPV